MNRVYPLQTKEWLMQNISLRRECSYPSERRMAEANTQSKESMRMNGVYSLQTEERLMHICSLRRERIYPLERGMAEPNIQSKESMCMNSRAIKINKNNSINRCQMETMDVSLSCKKETAQSCTLYSHSYAKQYTGYQDKKIATVSFLQKKFLK